MALQRFTPDTTRSAAQLWAEETSIAALQTLVVFVHPTWRQTNRHTARDSGANGAEYGARSFGNLVWIAFHFVAQNKLGDHSAPVDGSRLHSWCESPGKNIQ